MMDGSLRMLTARCRLTSIAMARAARIWVAGLAVGFAASTAALGADDAPPPAAVAPPAAVTPPTEAAPPAKAAAPTEAPPSEFSNLDNRIQDTKSEVIQLNRDLMVLEEELLFPASTQVAVFVSMDVGKLFDLDSVKVKLDDKDVANYLYTPSEVQALHRGGVQRVYLGNLRAGSHELVAFFTGGGPHQRDYRRATTVKFDKGTDPKYIELRIKDSTGKLQPEFDVKIWPSPSTPPE
jgi:hypothetical protein